jgi:hydroxyacylglutathione hydrolase
MQIEAITVGPFAMNCYLLIDENTQTVILIDPGAEKDRLIKRIEKNKLQVKYIINTHCHIDHTGAAGEIQQYFKIPFYIHEQELPLLNSLPDQGRLFGIAVTKIPDVTACLNDGDTLNVGEVRGTVLYTPGHSPGGLSFLFEDHVFVGDCLFMDSIGRTDLYGGNYDQLIDSIKNKLLTLKDETKVYSGHGPVTTIGRERRFNPFLQ